MTLTQLASRVKKLAKEIESLRQANRSGSWWIENSGMFRDDAVYAKIAREGKRIRHEQRRKSR